MKIILLKDVKNSGNAGDVKEVSDGYARNFLIPQKIAEAATKENIEKAVVKKREAEKLKNRQTEELKKLTEKLEGKEIAIKVKEKSGKLFGSVGKKEIAEKLGNEISEKMIELTENVKDVGKKEVIINFGNNIKTGIIVNIIGE